MSRKIILSLLGLITVATMAFSYTTASAAVSVRGYYRKDGTYVRPYIRSNPDGNPYNNWSYPGNINPYTGKVASGSPVTYMRNYCAKSPNNVYCSGKVSVPTIFDENLVLASPSYSEQYASARILKENYVYKSASSSTIYYVRAPYKFAFPNEQMFKNYGFTVKQIKVVDNSYLAGYLDSVAGYGEGNLLRLPESSAVWYIGKSSLAQPVKKLIASLEDFKKCGFSPKAVKTVYPEELARFPWEQNSEAGLLTAPACK